MSGIVNLLPTSIAISSDSSIGYILSDIPLFCEGIMGIGIFTFLFLVKQVRLLSIFLYGSALFAFAAATFDLGQNLARGLEKTEDHISLDTVWGILYAREVLFAFSIGFLELFFWKLVACCPIEETDISDFDTNLSRKHGHSANWSRWGLVGMFLKWISLAASLSIPLLQVLWRLLPNQRQYGSIYVAATTVETALAAIFVLKLVLNICISPNEWWYAFQSYVVPMSAISIEIGLGIADLVVFAFTDTTLGRLLRSVEVYLLILHNLHTVFRVHGYIPRNRENTSGNLDYKPRHPDGTILPFSSPDLGTPGTSTGDPMNTGSKLAQQIDVKPTSSKLSWLFPSRHSHDVLQRDQSISGDREGKASSSPASPTNDNLESGRAGVNRLSAYVQPSTSFLVLGTPTDLLSPTRKALDERAGSPDSEKQNTQPQAGAEETYQIGAGDANNGLRGNFKFPLSNSSPIASQQRNSIEDILRQQTELDNSIARLRLTAQADTGSTVPPKSRSTLNSSKTASISNRSDFSLSIFPDPPVRHTDTNAFDADVNQRKGPDDSIVIYPLPISPPGYEASGPADKSLSSEYEDLDVTSIPVTIPRPKHDEAMSVANATISPVPAPSLRPMILPSMITSSSQINISFEETDPKPLHTSEESGSILPSQPLRPFLLGKPLSAVPPLPATKVPLAQRRQRGGTIASNTRRPVISGPLISEERASPGVFERPRPPPLRL